MIRVDYAGPGGACEGIHPVPQPAQIRPVPDADRSLADLIAAADVPHAVLAKAACRGPEVPPWIFYSTDGDHETIAAAKRVCADCPVQAECLAYAMAAPEHGIWGGKTLAERNAAGAATRRPKQITHGTQAGYKQHHRRGEDACDACTVANKIAAAERRQQAAM